MLIPAVAFGIVVWLCALVVRVDRGCGKRLELTPSLVLVLSLGIYVAALPASRYVFGTTEAEIDADFMIVHLEMAAGLLAGFVVAHKTKLFRRVEGAEEWLPGGGGQTVWSMRAVLGLMAVVHCAYYLLVLRDVGYDPLLLLDRYGTGSRTYEEATLISTAVCVAATAVSWLACQVALRQRVERWQAAAVWVGTLLLAVLYLVRGNRNLLILLLLPIAASKLRRRWLPPGRLALGVVLAWLGLYTVGIVRNWGFGKLDEVSMSVEAYDPVRGEIGTMYSVYTKHVMRGMLESTPLYGQSFFVDPLVNLVPRQWWHDRPLTVAQEASVTYYGTGILSEGIGYSPVIEVMRNFTGAVVAPWFAAIAALTALFENLLDRHTGARSILYGGLMPMLVNYCRIDFATVFKMALLYALSLAACHLLAKRRAGGDIARRAAADREAAALGAAAAGAGWGTA